MKPPEDMPPTRFQILQARNDGFESGFTGKPPERRYDPMSELHDTFMEGYQEGTERRVEQERARYEMRKHDYNLRHPFHLDASLEDAKD